MCSPTIHEEPDIAVHPIPQPGHRNGVQTRLVTLQEVEGKGVLNLDIIMHSNLDV